MLLTYFFLTTLAGLVTYLYLLQRKRLNYWQSIGIACEEPNLIFGNVTGISTKRSFAQIWISYYKRFKGTGPFAGFYWFQQPSAFILDTDLVKNILIKDFNNFTDRGFYSNTKDDPLTGQLFLLDGHKWRNMRMKLSPTFTSGKMKLMFPIATKVAEEFIKVVGDMIDSEAVIEVTDLMARFTVDVIGTCAFGIECNSLRNPTDEFRIVGKQVFNEPRHGPLGMAFVHTFQDLARKLHMKLTQDHIEKFYMGIVRDTVEYREKNNVRRNDFMDMLIDLKNNKMMKSDDGEEMTNLTLEEIAAQAFVFLVAGFETSSTTMGFAIYELAQNEQIQDRAREEIQSVLKRHNQELTYECIKEMQYLDQIISETLRLYTVVPVLNRICLEDYVIPNNPKYVIKKGMPVLIPAAAIHRDPVYYPNPDVFNPDNFSSDAIKQRDSIEWLPFGDGPRNCVGMRFGLMQVRIGLSYLLNNFKFSVCSKTQIPVTYNKKSFLISAENGIHLKVQRV